MCRISLNLVQNFPRVCDVFGAQRGFCLVFLVWYYEGESIVWILNVVVRLVRDSSCALQQRALGVLGHQKRFLIEHKAGLEKWTSAVYGFDLSTEGFAATGLNTTAVGDRGKRDDLLTGVVAAGGPSLREVRVNVKCKGAKRRIDKQPLLAHVDRMWTPRQGRLKNVKKRSSVKAAEKPAKRGKLAVAKGDQAIVAGPSSTAGTAEEIVEDRMLDEHSDGRTDAPGQGWNGLEGSLPEDLSLDAEDRPGGNALTPSRSSGAAAKAGAEPGTSESTLRCCACYPRTWFTAPLFPVACRVGAAFAAISLTPGQKII